MFFKSRKILKRVKWILGRHSGGIYKRIDHNREILEYLRLNVPDFREKPWLESKLKSHDEFFCALAEAVALDDVQFAATPPDHPGRPFPRPWPDSSEPRLLQTPQLSEIRLDDNLVKDVQNVSTMIIDPDEKGLNDHWVKTSFDLMTGVIIFVLVSDELEKSHRNLATVQAILSDGGPVRGVAERLAANKDAEADGKTKIAEGFRAVMEYIRDTGYEKISAGHCTDVELVAWQTASQAAQSFLNKASNEASAVQVTTLSFLSRLLTPASRTS